MALDGRDPPDDPPLPTGEEELRLGVFEGRVAPRGERVQLVALQRRHPVCVSFIQRPWKGDETLQLRTGADDGYGDIHTLILLRP